MKGIKLLLAFVLMFCIASLHGTGLLLKPPKESIEINSSHFHNANDFSLEESNSICFADFKTLILPIEVGKKSNVLNTEIHIINDLLSAKPHKSTHHFFYKIVFLPDILNKKININRAKPLPNSMYFTSWLS